MHIYKEVTGDFGPPLKTYACDNKAEYIMTSAYAKAMLKLYYVENGDEKYPSSAWYCYHFSFERIL